MIYYHRYSILIFIHIHHQNPYFYLFLYLHVNLLIKIYSMDILSLESIRGLMSINFCYLDRYNHLKINNLLIIYHPLVHHLGFQKPKTSY
jgi:hypothetical protein